MRLLTSLFALLALASGVFAQNTFPLTSLTFAVTTASDSSALPQQPGTTQIVPSFSAYNQVSLRYAVEYYEAVPVNIQFQWRAQNVNGATTQISFRNCQTNLVQPTASNSYSYCSYVTALPYTDSGSTNTISVANVFGSNYFEFRTTGSANGLSLPMSYVVFVGVYEGVGSNMVSLDTDWVGTLQAFNVPYTQQTSQYTVTSWQQVPSASYYNVNFYFAAQTSVTTVFVQQCPGIGCAACIVTNTAEWDVIAGQSVAGYSNIPTSQLDLPNGNFGTTSFPLNGRYTFPAVAGSNCLRFINQVNAGNAGTNQYTITINMVVNNCGAYTTCQTCAGLNGCGWCLTNNYNTITGYSYCRVGTTQALTGGVCNPQSGLATPRYIVSTVNCVVVIRGDPRISGLQGQDFQVHGTPNEYFNLVSTASLQVNSRFVYLTDAKCDNFTTCFSHPGTYIDEVGVMMGENKVRLVAGAINEAARVFINGKEVSVSAHKHSAGKISVTFANQRRVVVKTPEIIFTVSQSDMFFNVESALLKTELLDQGSKLQKLTTSYGAEANTIMHGLIGQTWRNNVYAGDREYEGEVSDYHVMDGLWGSDFHFNLYQN